MFTRIGGDLELDLLARGIGRHLALRIGPAVQQLHASFVGHDVQRKHLFADSQAVGLLLCGPVPAQVVDKKLCETKLPDVL